jgi:hypothetical protein
MTRIELYIEPDPITAYITLGLKRRDGSFEYIVAIVDIGAEVTTIPSRLMMFLDYQVSERGEVIVEQAGIAEHRFGVLEVKAEAFLEDNHKAATQPFQTKIWFANTRLALLGVEQMLDRAILCIDMPNLTGYLEFPD